jgi:hypothetical protein
MSSNTYTLKIDIDDSKIRELEKRLMAIMGGKTAGLSGVKDAAEGKTNQSNLMKNIAKLGIIAIGVGSLVGLVKKIAGMMVESSPMLKGMLKLLNYSIMLILRPIGDFFGFFLRPLVIYFLRSVALPFYKQMRPVMQALGTMLGVNFLQRQSEIDSIDSKAAWEEGFTHSDGMKNLEKYLLNIGSMFSIFDDGSQYENTKEGIAALKGAFTAINGFTIPPLDTTGIDTWVADNLSIDNFPTLNLDNIQVKIDSAISAIGAFDFSEIFDTLETKFGKIFEDLWNLITSIFPWIPEAGGESTSTPEPTPVMNPYWSDSMNESVNKNNNNQPEEDPITAFGNWIQGGINEHIKGWLG